MIVKALSHKRNTLSAIRGLILYVRDPKKMEDRCFGRKPLIIKQYLPSYDTEKWALALKANDDDRTFEHARRTVLRHEIISFSPKSDPLLSRESLRTFAKYYLKNRVKKPTMGIAVAHYDESPHIHFVIAGVALDGSATRVSRKDFKGFKVELQQFQQENFPELSHSVVRHTGAKTTRIRSTRAEEQVKRSGKASEKEELAKTVTKLARGCTSLEELETKLERAKLRPYRRKGLLTGIWLGNRKFRLLTLGIGKEHLKEITLEQKRLNALNDSKPGRNNYLDKEY